MRLLSFLLAVALASGPPAARATTRLFLVERDVTGAGFSGSFDSADGAFAARLANDGADIRFSLPDLLTTVQLVFVAQGGGPPSPGTYEGVRSINYHPSSEGPLLGVYTPDNYLCDDFVGSFVVHELETSPGGDLLVFSADYVRTCERDAQPRMGSIRFRAGDVDCASVPEGAPCDDHDACTTSDTCHAGACVGTDDVTPGCSAPPPGQCRLSPLCNPADGACVVPQPPLAKACDDGDPDTTADACYDGVCSGCSIGGMCRTFADRDTQTGECRYVTGFLTGSSCTDARNCVGSGTCQDGTCVPETPPCDDHDPCTSDTCDARVCRHDALPGCWTMAGRSDTRFSADGDIQGHHVTCAYRCRHDAVSALYLDTGHFRFPGKTLTTCPSGHTVVVPDEVGDVRHGRQGHLRLTTSNLQELQTAARICQGTNLKVLSSATLLQPGADDAHLEGTSTGRVRYPNRIPIVGTTRSKVIATRRDAAVPQVPALTPALARLPACPAQIRLRCAVH